MLLRILRINERLARLQSGREAEDGKQLRSGDRRTLPNAPKSKAHLSGASLFDKLIGGPWIFCRKRGAACGMLSKD